MKLYSAHTTIVLRPFRDEYRVPPQAKGSEVGIIVLLRLLGSPQRVANEAHYSLRRIHQVKHKFGL